MVFRTLQILQKPICPLDAHQKHICAYNKNTNFCISYPGGRLKHISGTCASYPHQAMKYEFCEFVCLLKCASGEHIKHILKFA